MRGPLALLFLLLVSWIGVRAARADEVDALLDRLLERRPGVRVEALSRLGDIAAEGRHRDRILPTLLRVVALDPSADARQGAAVALGKVGDARTAPALSARLDAEREERVLTALLLALGASGSAEHVGRIGSVATTHPVPSVRAAAITALGALGGEAARRRVLALIESPGLPDPDWALRAAAVLALVGCGHADDVGTVLSAYRDGRGDRHWFARSALARLVAARDRDPLPILRRLVLDPDPRVAVTAAVGIAGTGHLQEVLLLLRHTSPSARAAAASAVARAEVRGAYGRLRGMARFDRSPRVRWAAALALFRLGEPEGNDYVLQALAAREPVVWAEAIAALTRRTGESHGRNARSWRAALKRWKDAQ